MEPTEEGLALISKAEKLLQPKELGAYKWALAHGAPELSADTQTKLFGLFLQGSSCQEIVKLNQGITLAQVLVSRIRWDWDERRQEYIEQLHANAQARLAQVTLEGVDFVATLMSAAHRQFGDALKRYIQTGVKEDLGPFEITGLRSYREAVELLRLLTGADKVKVDGKPVEKTVEPAKTAPTVADAKASLKAMLKKD